MGTTEFHTAFVALCEAFRNLTEVNKKAIDEVKAELVETNSKVDTLVSKSPSVLTEPWPNAKRRRSPTSTSPVPEPEIPKSSVGRKVMQSAIPIISNIDESDQDNFSWIWLSSFPPTVTEENIRSTVRECLSCDADETVDVKMLVKKDADITKLRAVSFKVGVDLKHKDAAMDGDNWPAGVAFREFIFHDRKATEEESSGFSKNRRLD